MAHCSGCGDDFPSDMMFEGLADKQYCAWCLGFDPDVNQPDRESLTPDEVEERLLGKR
jgi:hypothetical protein